MSKCYYCGKDKDLNKVYLDYDERNNTEENIVIACERCRENYLLKRAYDAVLVLKALGLKNNNKGEWVYDNKKIRTELVSSQALEADNERLRKEIVALQDKLKKLVNTGYEREIQLKINEWVVDFDTKKEFHCPICGKRIEWRKRNGRYESACCSKVYLTRIDRLIAEMI